MWMCTPLASFFQKPSGGYEPFPNFHCAMTVFSLGSFSANTEYRVDRWTLCVRIFRDNAAGLPSLRVSPMPPRKPSPAKRPDKPDSQAGRTTQQLASGTPGQMSRTVTGLERTIMAATQQVADVARNPSGGVAAGAPAAANSSNRPNSAAPQPRASDSAAAGSGRPKTAPEAASTKHSSGSGELVSPVRRIAVHMCSRHNDCAGCWPTARHARCSC